MSITRRGFLKGMAGILAASQAPAILARENVMDIYVPPKDIVIASKIPPLPERPASDIVDALIKVEEEIKNATGPGPDVGMFSIAGLRNGTRVTIMGENSKAIYANNTVQHGGRAHYAFADIVGEPLEIKLSCPGYKDETHFERCMGGPQKLVVNQTRTDAEVYDASRDIKIMEREGIIKPGAKSWFEI